MKLTTLATKFLLALAGGLFVAHTATAAPAYNPDDLLLGFRASGDTGVTEDVLVNIGPASSLSSTGSQSFSLGGLSSQLGGIFGSGWAGRADVFWSIAGTSGTTAVGNDPARTLYATAPETTSGTAALPLLVSNGAAQAAPSNKIAALGGAYVQTAGVPNTFIAGSSVAIKQSTTGASSYASFQTGSISYSYFEPTLEGNFGHGSSGSILDFYRLVPGNIGDPGTLLGRFIISSDGLLTFVPVAAFGTSTVQLAVTSDTVNDEVATHQIGIVVTRTGDTTSSASVTLATSDGTASAGTHYTAVNQTVTFAIGEVSKTINVPITNLGSQPDRDFNATLSNPGSGITLGTNTVETVTITAPLASTIQLSSASYSANAGPGTVSIGLVRTAGTSAVTVNVATADGPADSNSSVADATSADYSLDSTAVNFGVNATTATASVTLKSTPTTNKAFTVTISSPGSNPTIGSPSVATVYIFAADTGKPTVKLTAIPAVQLNAGTPGGSLTLNGSATDAVGVDHVVVTLNGGAPTSYPVTDYLKPQTSFAVPLTHAAGLVGGVNTVQVQAVDAKGNASPVASLTFTYVVKVALTVNTTGPGTVTGKLAGAVYQVGKTYTLTAVPTGPGTTNIFDNWSGPGLTSPATTQAKLTFVFSDALAASPTITATFKTNPFTSTVIGAYNGLVLASTSPAVTPSNATNGLITLNLTAAGSFSGTLKIDGLSLILSGQFDNTGHAVFGPTRTPTVEIVRTGKPSLVLSSVTLVDVATSPATLTHQITGVVGEQYRAGVLPWSTFTASLAAFSAVFGHQVPTHYTNVNKGIYNIVIPAQSQPVGSDLTTADYPQGDGIGTITISTAGVATLSGTLADGTAVAATVPLSTVAGNTNALTAPLFAQLYAAKAGSFGGLITLDDTKTNHDLSGTGLFWFKPYVGGQVYPYGWPEGVTTALYGAKYAIPSGVSTVPGLGATSLSGNATLTFSAGGLSPSITKDLNISATNAVTKLGTPADASYTLTLAASSGKFAGTFTYPDNTKPAFSGIVFSKTGSSYNGGYGYFLTTNPKPVTGLGQSGAVSLGAR